MATYVTYARRLVNRGQLSLLFVPGEFCYLILNSNPLGVPLDDRQEIGTYRHELTQAQVRELTALAEKALAEPVPEAKVNLGVRLLSFGMGKTGERPRGQSFPLDRPLPKFAEMFDQQALSLGAELFRHPHRTVQVEAAWAKAEMGAQEEPAAFVTLRNTGLVPVKVPNAAAAPADEGVGLSIYLRQMTMDWESFGVRLRKSELSQVSAPGAEPGDEPKPVVTLQPDEELVLKVTVRRQCYLSPGSVGGGVIVATDNAEIPEGEGVRGDIQVDLGAFAVKRKARTR
jgi:hypothetical protein